MSVVVGLKENNKVWLATDSQVTYGGSKQTIVSSNCLKIWKPSGHKNMCMGLVGSMRDNNILSTVDVWIDEATDLKGSYGFVDVVRDTVPKMLNELRLGRRLVVEDGVEYMQSSLLVGYRDKLFQVDQDGCVTDMVGESNIFSIGSGHRFCTSAYAAIRDIDALTTREKLIRCVAAACESDLYVNYPIILINTEDDEIEIYDGEYLFNGAGELLDMNGEKTGYTIEDIDNYDEDNEELSEVEEEEISDEECEHSIKELDNGEGEDSSEKSKPKKTHWTNRD